MADHNGPAVGKGELAFSMRVACIVAGKSLAAAGLGLPESVKPVPEDSLLGSLVVDKEVISKIVALKLLSTVQASTDTQVPR